METSKVSIDKPSLHWSDSYYSKVNKIISKNNKYNFSGKANVFHKVPTYYKISWLDFLPFFIGWFYSLFKVCKTYGMIRSSSSFYKPLYNYFRNWFWAAIVSFIITGPILFIVILVLAPTISIPISEYFGYWGSAFKTFISSGQQSEGIKLFAENIVNKFFTTDAWWITILLLGFVPCINISTFISYLCFNKHNTSWVQLIILENELKMKLSNFEKKKKGK